MGEPPVKVGVVDIGTNTMRLLVTDGEHEDGRWVEVTGLGVGVDESGTLSNEAITRTIGVFDRYGAIMADSAVDKRVAIATSASRDAANREEFFDRAEQALGVRPQLISGSEEARYAYSGATQNIGGTSDIVVTDIGGGSTEFVTAGTAKSVDIGSVRLTDRHLLSRPPDSDQLERAVEDIADHLADLDHGDVGIHIGVAGTWTSIAGIAQNLSAYDPERVHGFVITNEHLDQVAEKLRPLTIAETAAIPSLDPKRAPVILAGTLIATMITETLGVEETRVSEHDSLDGVAMELFALP